MRLTEKVFVYGDEEKRYSHIRRCLATAMHRLWRTSVVAAAAKLVLYSKQGSRWPASRPAALLCCSKISFTAPRDEWEMMKLFCYQCEVLMTLTRPLLDCISRASCPCLDVTAKTWNLMCVRVLMLLLCILYPAEPDRGECYFDALWHLNTWNN